MGFLNYAPATKVIPLISLSTLLTVFLGILILKERGQIAKKIIAGIIAVVGMWLLI